MVQKQASAVDHLKTVGVEDLASIVGCSVAHIYRLSSERRGLPPMIKIGQLVRFRIKDIETWLESRIVTIDATETTKQIVKRGRGRPRKMLK